MNPWIIPMAMSIFGAIQGISAGRDAESTGRQQKVLAEENALLERRELAEMARRQDDQDRKIRATALARAAASGVKHDTGTPAATLQYLEDEQSREMDWLLTSGASRIRLNLQGAKMRADSVEQAGKNQQYSSFFGGVTSAFGFANAGGMFTTPKTTSMSWTPAITGPK